MIRNEMSVQILVCLAAIFVTLAGSVWATETKTWPVTKCGVCHQNPGMRPGYIGKDGFYHDLHIDQQRFEQSTHYIMAGKYRCVDCHETGYDVFPHKEQEPMGCFGCHEDLKEKFLAIRASFQQSIHYDAEEVEFQCNTCHTVHYARKSRRMTLEEKMGMCTKCHDDRYNPTGLTLIEQHQWHSQAQLHLDKIACIACHTQPDQWEEPFTFKHRILAKDEASRLCDDCHSAGGKLADYLIDIGENPLQLDNTQLADKFYVSGATRIPWLDNLGLLLLLATTIGVLGHGLVRMGTTLLRRK
uniref:Doubled CXXCH domain-containing protein n=1 Tax=Candidatus Kentrum sp. FW TaxID=2126338 RepID=A0A450TK22_9GAMM|nr:MAG: doubled CXXCH domain-containing protein [Candidatus Kentron sp. FW]